MGFASAFRWEEDLRASFKEHADSSLWSPPRVTGLTTTVEESSCSEGRADLVWATFPEGFSHDLSDQAATLLAQPTCGRILSLLKPQSVRSETYLLERTGVSARTFRRWIGCLQDLDLVQDKGDGRLVLARDQLLPQIEITAFEFKLTNWRRALYQAQRYRTFAHRVFVVMPPTPVSQSPDVLATFRCFNIGLMLHGADGRSEVAVPARKRHPTSRLRYIMAIGMLLQDVPRSSPADGIDGARRSIPADAFHP